jgi:hypothetical protein
MHATSSHFVIDTQACCRFGASAELYILGSSDITLESFWKRHFGRCNEVGDSSDLFALRGNGPGEGKSAQYCR